MAAGGVARRGLMLVLSSPSGAGKTTLSRMLLAEKQAELSISVTTRKQRPGEVDGQHYHFIDKARFDQMVKTNGLLEWATVFGNSYGTPRGPVEAVLAAGGDIVSDIDWQGTQQLKATVRGDLVSVFVLPPSMAALEQRLRTRAQDSDEVVRQRMGKATDEMSHWPEYDYVFVNYDIDESVRRVEAIVTAERVRRERLVGVAEFVNRLRTGSP